LRLARRRHPVTGDLAPYRTQPSAGSFLDATRSPLNIQFHQTDDALLVGGGYGDKSPAADDKTSYTLTSGGFS